MIIAVDFDGTICEHVFPAIGKPVPYAFQWLRKFQALDAKLILWTMRSNGRKDGTFPLAMALAFCRSYGVEFWGVNGNPDQKTWTESPKAYAEVYIDDAAFGCPLRTRPGADRPMVDWRIVGPAIRKILVARKKTDDVI